MNEIFFDIEKYCFLTDCEPDVSFIPMMQRRKLNKFGRAALYTMYKVYNNTPVNLVFASEYGDIERVEKLINQRQEDGEVSPAGFSASVHNAVVGLFTLLKGINKSYNSISAGKKTISTGLLESILSGNSLFCYAESSGGLKSVSVLINYYSNIRHCGLDPQSHNRNNMEIPCNYVLCENYKNLPAADSFEDLISFLEGNTNEFITDLYIIKRRNV